MRKLLIIEPDKELCDALKYFLEGQKFEVHCSGSAEEGWSMIGAVHPDLLLISRELPMPDGSIGPDGLRVIKLIRQDKAIRKLPIIMTSASASDRDFERYRKLQFLADDYVRKPFEDTDIIRRIENLIGFDVSDSLAELKDRVDDVMNNPLQKILDADEEELDTSTAIVARQHLSELMAQVGAEIERQERKNNEPLSLLPWETEAPEQSPEEDYIQQIQKLDEELHRAQAELHDERAHNQELKQKWKTVLQTIDSRLKETQEREDKLRLEMERLRMHLSDIELDHTLEIEHILQEKRRLEEDLIMFKDKAALALRLPEHFLDDMKKAVRIIDGLVSHMQPPEKTMPEKTVNEKDDE